MSTNLTNKYKERNPQETIALIQQFFQREGYVTTVENNGQSEAKTWGCSVVLFKNGLEIMRAHGKGTTEIFSLASGHAELYERFCNNCQNIRNLLFCTKMTAMSHEKYGYYFHPDEKPLTLQETLQTPNINVFFQYLTGGIAPYKDALFLALTGGKSFGEPYISLTNPEEKPYYDRRVINRVSGSIGMSAGNTVAEALNQGLSELCEHYVTDAFFLEQFDKYYVADLDAIDNIELQEKIKAIRESGNTLYIFDLGYNFNLPVVLSVLINNKQMCTNVNFGSFPVFDIAVERIITEIYQGIRNYNNFNEFQLPWKSMNVSNLADFCNALTGLCFIDETIFTDKLQIVKEPSSVFLRDKNMSNEQINEYFIDLFKERNWSIHYINHGLDPNVAALQIFIPELNYSFVKHHHFEQMHPAQRKFLFTYLLRLYKSVAEFAENNNDPFAFEKFAQRFLILAQDTQSDLYDGGFIGGICFSDWYNVLNSNVIDTNVIFYAYGNNVNQQAYDSSGTIFGPYFKKAATLKSYVDAGYNVEEIILIFKTLFKTTISNEDIINVHNDMYHFNKYYNILKDYYNSKDYEEIVHSCIYKKI